MSDNFVPGLYAKKPHENAPEYVIAKVSIKVQDLLSHLQQCPDQWINAEVKVSREGKYYIQVDDWKPSQQAAPSNDQRGSRPIDDGLDDLPF